MTKINVKNGDWDGARAALKASLDAQDAKFNAQFAAAFGPPPSPAKPEAAAAGPQASAHGAPVTNDSPNHLARIRPRV